MTKAILLATIGLFSLLTAASVAATAKSTPSAIA